MYIMLWLVKLFKGLEGLGVIGSIICISFICHLSSSNPFENNYIKDLSNYFTDAPNITNLTTINEQKSRSYDKELAPFEKEEQIIEENKTNSSESTINKKLFLRRLVSTSYCTKIRNKLERYEGSKFSRVFDLKMKTIHKLSIGLIVVICFPIFCNILSVIYLKFHHYYSRDIEDVIICYFNWVTLALLTNLVLLIIFGVVYLKGDIGEYNNFLGCPNIKKQYFQRFSDVTKLRKYIIAFEILDSIFEVLGTMNELYEAYAKYTKNEEISFWYFLLYFMK